MKLILTVFAFLFISANAIWAQSNERKVIPTEGGKYVSCGHNDHGDQCGSYTFVPDEVTDVQASPAGPTGGCTPRPYRQLIAYDDALLANYTHQQIVTLVIKGHKQFADALDSSGITNQAGTIVVGIMPVKIPSYTGLTQVKDWINNSTDGILDSLYIIKNELLDADHLIVISREGITPNEKGINLQFINNPQVPLDLVYSNLWKRNIGVVNFITFVPNFTVTFAHESGHSVGGGHENSIATPTYAKAYVNSVKQVNCLMKGATVTNFTYNRFSGPDSKIVKNGETIVLCEDTAVHNNAKHISECLDLIWCATVNHVTRVSLPTTTCGSGKLQAITNNADTFQWKVLSGDCTINGTGQVISYMATTISKIQVIGWKQGKWYADTAVIEIPALQRTAQPMSECVGTTIMINGNTYVVSQDTVMSYMTTDTSGCEMIVDVIIKALPTSIDSNKIEIKSGQSYTLPDGKVVNTSGTYVSTLKNSFGCDSVITTVLTVTTATVDPEVLGILIYPNPVYEQLVIDGLLEGDRIVLNDMLGKKQSAILHEKTISFYNIPNGMYALTILRGDDRVVMKVLKL